MLNPPDSEEEFEARKAKAREALERMGVKAPGPLDGMTWEEFQEKQPQLEALARRAFTLFNIAAIRRAAEFKNRKEKDNG